jgi:hypothetical protein
MHHQEKPSLETEVENQQRLAVNQHNRIQAKKKEGRHQQAQSRSLESPRKAA